MTFARVDLDVVHEAQLDDVHPELRVLDLVQRFDDIFACDHATSVVVALGARHAELALPDADELVARRSTRSITSPIALSSESLTMTGTS